MSHRLLVTLTFVNLAGLVFALGFMRPAVADSVPDVLRARSLQIVDEKGRVRASIAVLPATTSATGERQRETVLLRLITEQGRPSVKIASSEESAGMSLTGPTGTKDTYIVLEAHGTSSSIKIRNESGKEQVLKP
jgi:hypothetical protein